MGSTPTTSCPSWARHPAETVPTYPSPNILILNVCPFQHRYSDSTTGLTNGTAIVEPIVLPVLDGPGTTQVDRQQMPGHESSCGALPLRLSTSGCPIFRLSHRHPQVVSYE